MSGEIIANCSAASLSYRSYGEDDMAIEPAPEPYAAPPVEGGVSAYLELLGGRDVRPRLFPLHD